VLNLEVAGTNTGDDVSFTVANIETVNLTVSAAAKLNGSTFANATALNITATANIDGDAADTIALAMTLSSPSQVLAMCNWVHWMTMVPVKA